MPKRINDSLYSEPVYKEAKYTPSLALLPESLLSLIGSYLPLTKLDHSFLQIDRSFTHLGPNILKTHIEALTPEAQFLLGCLPQNGPDQKTLKTAIDAALATLTIGIRATIESLILDAFEAYLNLCNDGTLQSLQLERPKIYGSLRDRFCNLLLCLKDIRGLNHATTDEEMQELVIPMWCREYAKAHQISAVVKLASFLDNTELQGNVLSEIAASLAEDGYVNEAIDLTPLLDSQRQLSEAHSAIAKQLVRQKYFDINIHLQNISYHELPNLYKEFALICIENGCIKECIQFTQFTNSPFALKSGHDLIAYTLCKQGYLNEALQWLESLSGDNHSSVSLGISKFFTEQHDYIQAKKYADSITNPDNKTEAILKMSKQLALSNRFEDCLQLLKELKPLKKGSDDQSYAFSYAFIEITRNLLTPEQFSQLLEQYKLLIPHDSSDLIRERFNTLLKANLLNEAEAFMVQQVGSENGYFLGKLAGALFEHYRDEEAWKIAARIPLNDHDYYLPIPLLARRGDIATAVTFARKENNSSWLISICSTLCKQSKLEEAKQLALTLSPQDSNQALGNMVDHLADQKQFNEALILTESMTDTEGEAMETWYAVQVIICKLLLEDLVDEAETALARIPDADIRGASRKWVERSRLVRREFDKV